MLKNSAHIADRLRSTAIFETAGLARLVSAKLIDIQKRIKIDWQFSIQVCREKMNRHYSAINGTNSKFEKKDKLLN